MTSTHAPLDPDALGAAIRVDIAAATTPKELDEARVRHLGKRSELKLAMRGLGKLPEQQRRDRAAALNEVAERAERLLADRAGELDAIAIAEQIDREWVDVSLPGLGGPRGGVHPIRRVEAISLRALRQLGFVLEDGPEAEDPYYNFDALNIPPHHPARDLQDTFYLQGGLVLRSHTTTIQARVLQSRRELPIRVVGAGRVYRNEAVDATHMAMFHQLEGFWVDAGITFAHLKGVLEFLCRALYGEDARLRVKPKYYPYTEPSIGLDIACTRCGGVGCEACHDAGWVTLIGAGMVHPNILRDFGYTRRGVRGFAFGWGTTRMTAQWLGLDKVRRLYEQDIRLLRTLKEASL